MELQRSLSKPVDFTSTPKNVLSERGKARIMEEDGGKKKEEEKFVTMDYRETIEKKRGRPLVKFYTWPLLASIFQ